MCIRDRGVGFRNKILETFLRSYARLHSNAPRYRYSTKFRGIPLSACVCTIAETQKFMGTGRACLLCPGISDINLFRYCQGVIDLDAEIPDRAFDLRMAEQELDGPQICLLYTSDAADDLTR